MTLIDVEGSVRYESSLLLIIHVFFRRAVDLCFALINGTNVRTMVKELLNYLDYCDIDSKGDVCSNLVLATEKYAPNKRWHIDAMLAVLTTVRIPISPNPFVIIALIFLNLYVVL